MPLRAAPVSALISASAPDAEVTMRVVARSLVVVGTALGVTIAGAGAASAATTAAADRPAVSVASAPTALVIVAATVTVDSATVPTGGSVTFHATGFAPGESVNIQILPQLVQALPADANGNLDATISLPRGTPAGTVTLLLTGITSGATASVTLTVLGGAAVTVENASVSKCGEQTFHGTGFAPGEVVGVRVVPFPEAGFTADANGNVNGTTGLPRDIPSGTATLLLTGQTSGLAASATFTVEDGPKCLINNPPATAAPTSAAHSTHSTQSTHSTTHALASTGARTGPTSALAAACLALGGVLVLVRRRGLARARRAR
jgi:hypothetical protein